jgi:hypothetical protein
VLQQNLKFKSTFAEDLEALRRDVQIVHNACTEVLDNPRLREFLVDILLSFGERQVCTHGSWPHR